MKKHLRIDIDNNLNLLLVAVPKEAYDFKISGNQFRYFMPNGVEIPQFVCDGKLEMVVCDFVPSSERPWQWEFNWSKKMPQEYDMAIRFWGMILKLFMGVRLFKAFPLRENPYGKHQPTDSWPRGDDAVWEHDTVLQMKAARRNWQEAEQKVMPERFVVLKVIKDER